MTQLFLPNAGHPTNGEDLDADVVRSQIEALLGYLQSLDLSNGQTGSLQPAAMAAGINPLLWRQDSFPSYISSGGLPSGYSVFNLTIPAITSAYFASTGARLAAISGAGFTVSASKDTYFSLNPNAAIDTPQAVTNGASQPSLPTGSQWLFKAVSDGTGITRIDDMRNLSPLKVAMITDSNSWKVRQYGTFKTYERSFAVNTSIPGAGSRAPISTSVPLPTGIANVNAIRGFVTWRGNFAGHLVTGLDVDTAAPGTSLGIYVGNIFPTALTFVGQIDVTLMDI